MSIPNSAFCMPCSGTVYAGKITAFVCPRFPSQSWGCDDLSRCRPPFHPGLCVSLSRCRLPPVINHSTLAYVYDYPGADCHQSSTIPPWPMCVTIQGQTATSHQPFHPGLCVSLSRGRLPPVINHSTLAYVYDYPGADCHQSSTIPPWPMCMTIQGQTATSHQPFHPGLCV